MAHGPPVNQLPGCLSGMFQIVNNTFFSIWQSCPRNDHSTQLGKFPRTVSFLWKKSCNFQKDGDILKLLCFYRFFPKQVYVLYPFDSVLWNNILGMYIYYFHKVQSINACPYAHFMATEEPWSTIRYLHMCIYTHFIIMLMYHIWLLLSENHP